jgi:hypothetical protein
MLKMLIFGLTLTNLIFGVWAQGWVDGWFPWPSRADAEPERVSKQIAPERMVFLTPQTRTVPATAAESVTPINSAAVSSAASDAFKALPRVPTASSVTAPSIPGSFVAPQAGSTTLFCRQAGPFNSNEWNAAHTLSQAIVPNRFLSKVADSQTGVWMVYLGPYPTSDALQKKVAEIRRIKVEFYEIRNTSSLSFGISLGRYSSQANAEAALKQANQRGVRTARIIQVASPETGYLLRAENLRAEQVVQLQKLPGLSKAFEPCTKS